MEKIDLKRVLKEFYSAKQTPDIVNVPTFQYITILGAGDPNDPQYFSQAVEPLYAVAYKLKFMIKRGETYIPAKDYTVMPLEGQWWADDMQRFRQLSKSEWKWKLAIMVPDELTQNLFDEVISIVSKKKSLPRLSEVKLESITDGLAAQIMHIGPYANEAPTIDKLHKFINEEGYKLAGIHREIYIGDPRKGDQSKLKTIIRQPMEAK